jgi:hypothetical protein
VKEKAQFDLVVFILSIAGTFVAFWVLTSLYIWPALRKLPKYEALKILALPHAFRFIGLSFLFPGVVSPRTHARDLHSRGVGRLCCRDSGPTFDRGANVALVVCDPACVDFQLMGHDRPSLRLLQRHRAGNRATALWRGVLHSDDDRATASRHPHAYFPDPLENRKSVGGVMNRIRERSCFRQSLSRRSSSGEL